MTLPWGFKQRHKLTEILNHTDLVTIPGTDIIISFCLGLRLATPAINREQELNNRREKRKAKQGEVISSTCWYSEKTKDSKVKAKQVVYKKNNGIAKQKKRYNQERINVLNDGTILILVGASEEICISCSMAGSQGMG